MPNQLKYGVSTYENPVADRQSNSSLQYTTLLAYAVIQLHRLLVCLTYLDTLR